MAGDVVGDVVGDVAGDSMGVWSGDRDRARLVDARFRFGREIQRLADEKSNEKNEKEKEKTKKNTEKNKHKKQSQTYELKWLSFFSK